MIYKCHFGYRATSSLVTIVRSPVTRQRTAHAIAAGKDRALVSRKQANMASGGAFLLADGGNFATKAKCMQPRLTPNQCYLGEWGAVIPKHCALRDHRVDLVR